MEATSYFQDRQLSAGTLDPVRLAILADAAEKAGLPSELNEHLRTPGPHYRGCWSLDLLLGKS